ncbi:hypothetical protein [Saccharothrix hoggarensis]|uniref:Secreted protein n=1 Tax=Saccharothrix hoggarensis TaxID=913853 RepID=A0ABW3QXY0_9PSEU
MRSIIRLVAAGAVSLPILVGAAGLASADVEYEQSYSAATAQGAVTHSVESGAGHGYAYFHEQFLGAGPQGAGYYQQGSFSHPHGAHYGQQWGFSGPEGAFSGSVGSSAEADHHESHDQEGHDQEGHDHHADD